MYFFENSKVVAEHNSCTRSATKEEIEVISFLEKYGFVTNGLYRIIKKYKVKDTLIVQMFQDGFLTKIHLEYDDGDQSTNIYSLHRDLEKWSPASILVRLSLVQAIHGLGEISRGVKFKNNTVKLKDFTLASIRRNDLSLFPEPAKNILYVLEDEEMAKEIFNIAGLSFNFITDEMSNCDADSYLKIIRSGNDVLINEYPLTHIF